MVDVQDTVQGTLAALERRVRQLEDHVAIYQLMMTYGPAVDSDSGDIAGSLWAENGSYDFGVDFFKTAKEVQGMVDHSPLMREALANGCAHLVSPPLIRIDGERAEAVCYQQILRRSGDGFQFWRVSANHWEFARTADGWKVAKRVARLIGSPASRQLLKDGLAAQLDER